MKNSGFTLVELLIAVALVGLLSSVVLSALTSARTKARDNARIASARAIAQALESYNIDNETYAVAGAGYRDSGGGEITASGTSDYSKEHY